MHFKKVVNTINRPHFLAERDGEEILLNFSHDHKSLRSRSISDSQDAPAPFLGDPYYNPLLARLRAVKPSRIVDMDLSVYSKHGLGATDGKVYFFDDSSRTEKMKVWRVDSRTGVNENTTMASGFTTRFGDSDYFIVTKGRQSHTGFVYQWKTNEDAALIKKLHFPKNFADHTRIAYGSKILFVNIERNQIMITSIDVISEEIKDNTINFESDIDEKKMRWFCAKNYLMAAIGSRFILIQTASLTYEVLLTNLDEDGKYHVFAVDSNGFVYVLNPTATGCAVMRARDIGLSTIQDIPIVIPVKEEVREARKEPKLTVTINFHVSYKGETLLNNKLTMLGSNRLGDMILRSPEVPTPPNTRLRILYKNEEVLTFRTPNFLRMKDGDSIFAEFIDNANIADRPELNQGQNRRHHSGSSEPQTGFFSQDMLSELGYSDAPSFQKRENINNQKKPMQERPNDRRQKQKAAQERPVPMPRTMQPESATPPTDPTARIKKGAAPRTNSTVNLDEKLLDEMRWLRKYVEEKVQSAPNGGENAVQDELDQLKKKYARVLLMMGRSQLKK